MRTYGFSTTTTTTTATTSATPTSETSDESRTVVSQGQDRVTDNTGSGPPSLGDNLLQVSVYYNTLNEKRIETSKVYDVSKKSVKQKTLFVTYSSPTF